MILLSSKIVVMAREHKIPRTVFTAEQLRREPKLPGFFDNGPAHFNEQLLDGENYFNPVYALALILKTSRGYMQVSAVRSPEEERQPNVASSVTTRRSHYSTRKIMTAYSDYRVPILGSDPADIQREGYHITDIDPLNPVLVADYTPAPLQPGETNIDYAFLALIDKMRPDPYNDRIPYSDFDEEIFSKITTFWPGPMVIGVSEVGEGAALWTPETPYEQEETYFEANIMGTIVAAADVSNLTPDEVQQLLTMSNVHYSHFDVAPLDTFDEAVRNGVVDLIAPRFKDHNPRAEGVDLPLYILACAKGLCLRAAALALMRHVNYVRTMFGDDPIDIEPSTDTKKIYQMPKKLWLPDR